MADDSAILNDIGYNYLANCAVYIDKGFHDGIAVSASAMYLGFTLDERLSNMSKTVVRNRMSRALDLSYSGNIFLNDTIVCEPKKF